MRKAYLVQILLPSRDDQQRSFKPDDFVAVSQELTNRFGGATAYTRSPAEGRWRNDDHQVQRDEIVIVEVVVGKLEIDWWKHYQSTLKERFKQEELLIRAHQIMVI